jgi:hypothetical protein
MSEREAAAALKRPNAFFNSQMPPRYTTTTAEAHRMM